jgi:hypothetical protein|tara:strand:+ start:3176 stop:4000 length:825 start_codon:yes stop_codon:yes gene_type:complete
MEKYTAKQWAEIEGGHTMSEDKKSQYGFIKDLNESRLFRTKQRVEGSSSRDMADLAFMNMLSLYIMSHDYDMAPAAKEYAQRTMKYGSNFNYQQGGTDLHVALASLKNGMSGAGAKNQMQNSRVNLPEMQIRQFLNNMKQGRAIPSPETFFMRLERGLDIQNSNYRSIRRLAQNWPRLNNMQKSLVITRMNQYYRNKALRSELYSYIRDIGRTQGLMIKNAGNAEAPRMRGSDTLAKIAGAAAGIAGGYALGKSFAKDSFGTPVDQKQVFRSFR